MNTARDRLAPGDAHGPGALRGGAGLAYAPEAAVTPLLARCCAPVDAHGFVLCGKPAPGAEDELGALCREHWTPAALPGLLYWERDHVVLYPPPQRGSTRIRTR